MQALWSRHSAGGAGAGGCGAAVAVPAAAAAHGSLRELPAGPAALTGVQLCRCAAPGLQLQLLHSWQAEGLAR